MGRFQLEPIFARPSVIILRHVKGTTTNADREQAKRPIEIGRFESGAARKRAT